MVPRPQRTWVTTPCTGQPPDLDDPETANRVSQLSTVYSDDPPGHHRWHHRSTRASRPKIHPTSRYPKPDDPPSVTQPSGKYHSDSNQDWLSTREASRVVPIRETRAGKIPTLLPRVLLPDLRLRPPWQTGTPRDGLTGQAQDHRWRHQSARVSSLM